MEYLYNVSGKENSVEQLAFKIKQSCLQVFDDVFFLVFSSNGSVKVDFQLLVNSKSNVTAQAVNQTLLKNNATNSQGFIFGNILVQGKFILALLVRQSWKN